MSNTDDHSEHFSEELRRIFARVQESDSALPFLRENSVGKVDIVNWLAGIKADKKCYWKSRDGQFEMGGVGAAYSISNDINRSSLTRVFDSINAQPDSNLIFFSAQNFSGEACRDDIWKDFPDRLCFIPERMIIRRGNDYKSAVCLGVSPDNDLGELITDMEQTFRQQARTESSKPEFNIGFPVSINQFPDFDHWKQNIEQSLKEISSGYIKKIVLARRTDFTFEKQIDPLSLLASLKHANPGCFAILYQPRPGTAFISLTPERLYRCIDGKLEVDAMSSTVPRGATPQEDRQMAHELMSNDKLRREQQLVIDGNVACIAPLIYQEARLGETSVLKLERIQHLITPIEGNLRGEVTDNDIINSLHPTPAVGGTPRDRAVDMIDDMERFDRGWYAAPIGFVTDGQSEFAVGIRSLLVRGNTISVFAGAGIVEGSDPESEWREINSKDILRPILNGVTAR
jgi:menaquinone-specific isochorismate synthase